MLLALLIFCSLWHSSGSVRTMRDMTLWFDLDGDSTIGFGDFLIFANAFGKVVSSN